MRDLKLGWSRIFVRMNIWILIFLNVRKKIRKNLGKTSFRNVNNFHEKLNKNNTRTKHSYGHNNPTHSAMSNKNSYNKHITLNQLKNTKNCKKISQSKNTNSNLEHTKNSKNKNHLKNPKNKAKIQPKKENQRFLHPSFQLYETVRMPQGKKPVQIPYPVKWCFL